MIENPYKRSAPLPKKTKGTWIPRMCSLRSIIVGILLVLAILTWYLHVRGDYTSGDAKGIPAGKLRGKSKVDGALENATKRTNGKQKQEESEEETISEEPIINKWKELAKLKPSLKPSMRPTIMPTLVNVMTLTDKKYQSSNTGAGYEEIHQQRNSSATVKHATLKEERIAVTQPPIQIQRTMHREEPSVTKQHDDDDVKEEEGGESQQQVKLITGKAKKPSSAADKVDHNVERITSPVPRVTPRVVMRSGSDTKIAGEQSEQRPVTLVVGNPDKSNKKTSTSIEESEEQIKVQKGEEKEEENKEQHEEGEQGQENAPVNVRGQAQVQQPDAEETELHDTLQAEVKAQQVEATREVIHPKVVIPLEDHQQQQQQQQQTDVQISTVEQKEQEEIRRRRDSALKHAMLRDEQKASVIDKTPVTDTTITTTTSSSSSSGNEKPKTHNNPPLSASKTNASAKKTVANKSSSSKPGKKGKSVISKYQKPKQPMVPSSKKRTNGDQLDTPESRKLAAANAAAAAAGAVDLLDIENLTPVEIADGGNHEKDKDALVAVGDVAGEGVKGQEAEVPRGPIDCSGSSDPFLNQPIETYEPPAKADLKSKMEWGDAVRDMISRISHMKIGGDKLRLAIRDEIRTMQVLRVKMFCEVAAAAELEMREKSREKRQRW